MPYRVSTTGGINAWLGDTNTLNITATPTTDADYDEAKAIAFENIAHDLAVKHWSGGWVITISDTLPAYEIRVVELFTLTLIMYERFREETGVDGFPVWGGEYKTMLESMMNRYYEGFETESISGITKLRLNRRQRMALVKRKFELSPIQVQ